ncbi:MAG TPA: OsmC family protein [Vicinamibacterales bacterium]|nr:OsmC family protein [Vicinamibacterales bacterium]
MHPLPHRYAASASAAQSGDVALDTYDLPSIISASPSEFGGPGDRWSPETLLVAAIADCLVLTFRGMAKASNFEWRSLSAHVSGTLDRVGDGLEFTHFRTHVLMTIADASDEERARRLIAKAEKACLIARSLKAKVDLEMHVECVPAGLPAMKGAHHV